MTHISSAVSEQIKPQLSSVKGSNHLTYNANANASRQILADNTEAKPSVDNGNPKGLLHHADKQLQTLSRAATDKPTDESGKEQQAQSLQQGLESIAKSSSAMSPLQIRKLEFSTVQESGRTVVRVIDKESDDVIRQIPSEEFIRVAQKVSDFSEQMSAVQGVLFDSKV